MADDELEVVVGAGEIEVLFDRSGVWEVVGFLAVEAVESLRARLDEAHEAAAVAAAGEESPGRAEGRVDGLHQGAHGLDVGLEIFEFAAEEIDRILEDELLRHLALCDHGHALLDF